MSKGRTGIIQDIRVALRPERLRLASGIVLFTFLTCHLLNHSLGLISVDAMESGRAVFLAVWRSYLGTVVLFGALTLHLCFVLVKLLRHRAYRRLPRREILQIILGLLIPPLMILHLIGTRFSHEVYGIEDSYRYVLYSIWVSMPLLGLLQSIGVFVAWVHGCLGLHFWMRLNPGTIAASPISTASRSPCPCLLSAASSTRRMRSSGNSPMRRGGRHFSPA